MSRSFPYPQNYPLPTLSQTFDLKIHAPWHENNRQKAITRVLADLFLVAVKGFIKQSSLIKLEGADWQSWESTNGNQAAHCVPRQLYIGSQTFDNFLETCIPDRVNAMVILFADTDDLPANYNRADSLAETKGLVDAFKKACVQIVDDANAQGKLTPDSAIANVKRAFAVYRDVADDAFTQSILHLNHSIKQPNVDAAAKKRRTERIEILKLYQAALSQSQGHNEAVTFPYVEGLLRIYK